MVGSGDEGGRLSEAQGPLWLAAGRRIRWAGVSFMRLAVLASIVFALACDSNTTVDARFQMWRHVELGEDSTWTYEARRLECSTGRHEFTSLSDFCAALRNDDLNANCAPNFRAETFLEACADDPNAIGS